MTETQLGGNAASAITPGRLVLLRHGQTVWSESGQHTGRTNIPLTDIGCDQARAAGERLREAFPQGFAQGCMFASPLRRAQQTAQLAGYGDFEVLPEIAEWDYGRAEGPYAPGCERGGRFRLGCVARRSAGRSPNRWRAIGSRRCRTASRCPCTTVRVRRWRKLRRAHVRRSPRSNRCSTLETMCCWWRMRTFFVS